MKTSDDLSFLIAEPSDAYHARAGEYLSSGLLKAFQQSPLLYYRRKHGLAVRKDTRDLLIGRATHALVLEGHATFDAEYVVGAPVNPKTGKPFNANSNAYKAWAAAHGKPVFQPGIERKHEAAVRLQRRVSPFLRTHTLEHDTIG